VRPGCRLPRLAEVPASSPSPALHQVFAVGLKDQASDLLGQNVAALAATAVVFKKHGDKS
jgi:hypothetical protein